MKTIILFILLAFPILQEQIPPTLKIISHSNYSDQNGIACVLYNKKFYCMKWFGNDNLVLKEKRWVIKQVNECGFGGPNSIFQVDFNDSEEAKNEILTQLLRNRKFPAPPK